MIATRFRLPRNPATRLALVTLAALFGSTVGAMAEEIAAAESRAWRTDFETAQSVARTQKKPLLIHFYADWCGPCRRMEREVLASPRLTGQFEEQIIAVKVNSDRHPRLVQRFGIRALPSDILLAPNGDIVSRSEGYQSAQQYLARVTAVIRKFPVQNTPPELAQTEPPRAQTSRAQASESQPARSATPPMDKDESDSPREPQGPDSETRGIAASGSADPEDPDSRVAQEAPESAGTRLETIEPVEKVPVDPPPAVVGLDSYSPVSLWTWREWRRGKPEYAHEFRGIVYLMATAEELEEFRKDPRQYAPRLLGCDPVILAETDRALPGDTQYGAYFDGYLYLFQNEENRAKFKKNPLRYSRTRHAIRVQDLGRPIVR